MNKSIAISVLLLMFSMGSNAQETAPTKTEIDPTKPTNLYTQVNASLEYQSGKTQNLFGVRTNVQYALNPDNLFLVELPFLYNDKTEKFGIGDMRVRYFTAVKRNISKSFIAIVPFADVSFPIGSYKNGLGTSSWSLAGGAVLGFIISKKLSIFPGASYVHITKPATNILPETSKFSSDGVGFQFNASYVINKKTFLFVNPTPTFLSTNGQWKTFWSGEVNLNRIIIPNKFKVNAYWGPNFTTDVHILRLGATMYL
ncbi:hypothetical protein [Flavobacterium restrictum]|uniref:Transporter n=1 Tax=Flavobacterium restrictum TaxID=2594428 RepID=A0A553ECS8_9FLAO|nr:hypothetical protein [Flavobacterium restrictum]TRX42782.1 hypothetical protein FNW21_00150 [Flavobacterium restrictum]